MTSEDNNELLPPEQAFEWPRQSEKQQHWEEASRRWAILRKAYPEHPDTWLQGAKASIELGDLPQAGELLQYSQQHFSSNPGTPSLAAELAMRKGEWDTADSILIDARYDFPENMSIWLKSSEFAIHNNKPELALEYNTKARQCAPEQLAPYLQYAELAMQSGQWELALERWKNVRSKFPKKPAGYHRAAEAARQLNQPKLARQLTLAHQYGEDVFDKSPTNNTQRKNKQNNLAQFLELIWVNARLNLRSETHRNYLSYGWWVLEPLLHMVVYYVVFALLLKRGGENFTVFLLTGLIPWMWFMKVVGGSSNSIIAGQNLMLQVGLRPITFPLVSILQFSIKQIPVFLLLISFVWLQGYSPNANWWSLIPVILVQALIIIAFACAVAALIPFIRDLSYLVPTGLTFLMFLSGIFYDYRRISPDWQEFFLLNPMAFLLKCYREIFMENTTPDMITLSLWGIGSAMACILLVFIFQRLRYVYPRVVLE